MSYGQDKPIGAGDPAIVEGATCFDVELVIICDTHDQQVVYVREVGGTRSILILTGIFEATQLANKLHGNKWPRPLMHDAMLAAIRALGGEVEDVLVHHFEEHTYFSQLRVRQNGKLITVDTRPSDAFNIAISAGRPIFFSDEVVDKILGNSPNRRP
jgi:bifunctional DNase/RNase